MNHNKQASAVIRKQVLAFGKSEKSEFINIRIFPASSAGRKGRRHIGRFMPDRERSMYAFIMIIFSTSYLLLLLCQISGVIIQKRRKKTNNRLNYVKNGK